MSRIYFCRLSTLILFISFLTVTRIFALEPERAITQYVHRVWQTKDGLPVNSVRMVTQSRDGYLWLATSEGAVRFDGVRFETFSVKNQPALKSNDFYPIFAANDGSVWAGGIYGGVVRFKEGIVETFTTADGLAGDEVYAIYQSRDGSMWFGTRNKGISRYKDGKFVNYTQESLSTNIVWQFAETSDNSVWAAASAGGLLRFKNGSWTTYGTAEGVTAGNIVTLCTDKNSRLWLGGSGGLNVWENDKFSNHTKEAGLNGTPVGYVLSDRHDNLWVATINEGLIRYSNGQSAKFTTLDGLSSNSLAGIFEDNEGSLWVTGESGGLNQFYDGAITPFTTREGLGSNLISTVLQTKNGDIWFGTDSGISRMRGNEFTNFTIKDGISDKLSQALWESKDGSVWIGTATQGIDRLQNGKFQNFGKQNSIPRSYIRAIRETQNNDLWIAMEDGLLRWHGDEKTYFTTENGLIDSTVRVLLETLSGDFWIGTQNGLQRFDGTNFQTFTTADGLPGNIIASLHSDKNGAIWVGTNKGLAKIDNSGVIKSVTSRDGLYHDTIYSVLSDDTGNLWMSCATGIFRVSKNQIEQFLQGEIKKITSVNYNTADGMKSAEASGNFQPSAWRANDGKLWFPTTGGTVVIDPDNLRESQTPPAVLVENILLDEKPLLASERLDVPAGASRIDFQFTAPSFRAPEKMKFQYQLVGYDKDWHNAENGKRQISYTNLPPGDYTFRVKAANENGVWSETGASLAMYVAPRFYQTWWFYALCALSIIGTGFLIYSLRLRQMKQRFALVLEERTRIAREIHDTLAQNFLATSLQLEAAEETLNGNPNSALKKHLSQARTLAREGLKEARNSISALRYQKAIEEKSLVVNLEKFAHQAAADSSVNLKFKVNGRPRRYSELIEHNLFRIGQEAINNALKHASAKHIAVELNFNSQNLQLRVADDGRGFDMQTAMEKNVTNGIGGSYGLIGLKERAKIIGAQFEVKSEKGRGTAVSAIIKNTNVGN